MSAPKRQRLLHRNNSLWAVIGPAPASLSACAVLAASPPKSESLGAVRSSQVLRPTFTKDIAPGYGEFQHERRLTAAQIALFKCWADAGAPKGDPVALPPARRTASGGTA